METEEKTAISMQQSTKRENHIKKLIIQKLRQQVDHQGKEMGSLSPISH